MKILKICFICFSMILMGAQNLFSLELSALKKGENCQPIQFTLNKATDSLTKFVINIPPSFVLMHKQTEGENCFLKFIPKGESLDNWSKMITVQRGDTLVETLFGVVGSVTVEACKKEEILKTNHRISEEGGLPKYFYTLEKEEIRPEAKGGNEIITIKIEPGRKCPLIQYSIRYDEHATPGQQQALRKKMEDFLNSCEIRTENYS